MSEEKTEYQTWYVVYPGGRLSAVAVIGETEKSIRVRRFGAESLIRKETADGQRCFADFEEAKKYAESRLRMYIEMYRRDLQGREKVLAELLATETPPVPAFVDPNEIDRDLLV